MACNLQWKYQSRKDSLTVFHQGDIHDMKLCKTINQKILVSSLVVQMNPPTSCVGKKKIKKQNGYKALKKRMRVRKKLNILYPLLLFPPPPKKT